MESLVYLFKAELGSLRVGITWVGPWVPKGESCKVWLDLIEQLTKLDSRGYWVKFKSPLGT